MKYFIPTYRKKEIKTAETFKGTTEKLKPHATMQSTLNENPASN